MTRVEICHVPAADIPEVWQEILPLVEIFCQESSGRYRSKDVLMELVTGTWDLWTANGPLEHPAWGVTAILLGYMVKYPCRLCYEPIGVVGRDAKAWVDQFPKFAAWAKERGAAMVRLTAPVGWERLLKDQGFSKLHVVLVKDL